MSALTSGITLSEPGEGISTQKMPIGCPIVSVLVDWYVIGSSSDFESLKRDLHGFAPDSVPFAPCKGCLTPLSQALVGLTSITHCTDSFQVACALEPVSGLTHESLVNPDVIAPFRVKAQC